eukprot:1152272-Pelagomonas_calceolata.AAC.22
MSTVKLPRLRTRDELLKVCNQTHEHGAFATWHGLHLGELELHSNVLVCIVQLWLAGGGVHTF